MLDFDLAQMYEVKTGSLNQSVKRNIERFPSDFMFQLNADEWEEWKSQIVISKSIESNVNPNLLSQNVGKVMDCCEQKSGPFIKARFIS